MVKTKRCIKCNTEKGLRSFSRAATGYYFSYCKLCARAHAAAWLKKNRKKRLAQLAEKRVERRAWLAQQKAQPCADCGQQYPPYVMDYDHRQVSSKKMSISAMVLKEGIPFATILAEIAKCDLVCANCHRERTHQQRLRGEIRLNKRKT